MKKQNKARLMLYSMMLGVGVIGIYQPIETQAAPKVPYENKNCESGCNTDRSRSQIKRYFVNFPTTTKDKISYYENTTDPKNSQQGPLINPNRFAYYTSSKTAGGRSQLTPFEYSGEYTAKWNDSPKVGEFNNIIEWNLSANINE